MCTQIGKGGFDMPAFSFEKILPPTPPAPVNPADTAHRGVIVQLFDRIAEARMQRDVRAFSRHGRRQGDTDPASECDREK